MSERVILLIGATGAFGRRLAGHLAKLAGVRLIVTSRALVRAEALAADLVRETPAARVEALAYTHGRDAAAVFAAVRPWLVIDAAGPFQGAGYDTARAALEAEAHWIDLADARDYILGFPAALSELAWKNDRVALSGASTTPALTAAVTAELTRGWQRIDSVDIAILPGGASDVGRSVVDAILTYAGTPIPVWRENEFQRETGWGRIARRRFSDLGVRYVSPVETADADLLSVRFGVSSRVDIRAGLESRLEQFGLWALAQLRARGWMPSLAPLAGTLHGARRLTRMFCENRGGMEVRTSGINANGRSVTARWCLLAENGDGPHVPVLPALAMTRALLAGDVATGARAAIDVVSLDAIETEMRRLSIRTTRAAESAPKGGLFQHVIGENAYAALPSAVQGLHAEAAPAVWRGFADVDTGQSPIAWLSRLMFGFPPGGRGVPVTVTIARDGRNETWTRNLGGHRFRSILRDDGGGCVTEQFGPFRFRLQLAASDDGIEMPLEGWWLGPIPMPGFLAPRSETREWQDEQGRFRFDVRISSPLFSLLAHYRGWLMPIAGSNAPRTYDDGPLRERTTAKHPEMV